MKYLHLFCLFNPLISALGISPNTLFRRQIYYCESGEKECGVGCIPNSYTCCPDATGGCPSSENCQLGSNGVYGCCPKGENCVGDGGVDTYTDIPSTSYYVPTTTYTTVIVTNNPSTYSGGSGYCESGWKSCGIGCIPDSWTCCPDASGGCNPNIERCWLLTDINSYGCCSNIFSSCTDVAPAQTSVPLDWSDTTHPTSASTTPQKTSTANPIGISTSIPTTSRATPSPTAASTTPTTTLPSTSAAATSFNQGVHVYNNPMGYFVSGVMAAMTRLRVI